MTFRLGHISDPHFRGFAGATPLDFLGKRAAGMVNLLVHRRRQHKMELLAALQTALKAHALDHLAITGDLSNVSLEGEWREALRWIDGYGAPADKITVIPGNHDCYVEEVVRSRIFERMFAPYMTADTGAQDDTYPFVRIRGDVAVVAMNTCVPTGDLGAWGRIGEPQLVRLEALLSTPVIASKVRVVLIHHPPVVHKGGEDRNLRDRDAFAAVLKRAGAELVLHGHDHRDFHVTLEGPGDKQIPVVGAGSASYAGRAEHRSRFNVYEIVGRQITLATYVHEETSGAFKEMRRAILTPGAA
jgi:3',5'-cyclic AMP phosphodiesterase CpdA